MPKVITINYKPRNWAKEFHEAITRWIVLVLHRRAGKTTAILNHLQRDALRTIKSQYAFIAPTYKQAKLIAWDIAKEISVNIPGVVYNESELSVKYPNGSKLFLAGSDNVDSLRGIPLWGGGQDETAQQPSNLFSEVISKCLADHLGYWIWGGTPKGKGTFFKTYQVGLANPDQYTVIFKTIDDTLANETGETIDNLRIALEDDRKLVAIGEMTEDEFKQEWYCSFEASVKGAVYTDEWNELTKTGRLRKIDFDPFLPTYSAWDFGIGDATSIGIFQIQPSIKREIRLIDYYENNNKDLQHYLDWLKNKPYKLTMSYGDPSGQNRNLNTGRSLFEDLNSERVTAYLGYPMRMFARRTLKIDQIHAVKKVLKELWVDEGCLKFTEAIANYHYIWDEKKNEFQEEPYHDWSSHAMDSLAYFAVNFLKPVVIDPIEQKIRDLNKTNFDISSDFYANQVK